jgi:hypothetical protein
MALFPSHHHEDIPNNQSETTLLGVRMFPPFEFKTASDKSMRLSRSELRIGGASYLDRQLIAPQIHQVARWRLAGNGTVDFRFAPESGNVRLRMKYSLSANG